jgi:hypothetical protein
LAIKDLMSDPISALLEVAVESHAYSRRMAMNLLKLARSAENTWRDRCMAVLLLENQMLKVQPDDFGEFEFLFAELGILSGGGAHSEIASSVLQEGFNSTELRTFVHELRARIGRLDRVHCRIRKDPASDDTRCYLARVANEPTKLTLTRWIFSPEEVTAEIVARLRVGCGVETTLSKIRATPAAAWVDQPPRAPEFEGRIVSALCADRKTYWVSPECSEEMNALVEYPLTSAAVAIKLPGSDVEIEIKRAGSRGTHLVNVITERNGARAPISHRLFGGSLGWLGQRETVAAGLFSHIFRLVHGTESPCSETVQSNGIVTLPVRDAEAHFLDYLTDEAVFGEGFETTREAMRMCVEAFPSDTGVRYASYSGPQGKHFSLLLRPYRSRPSLWEAVPSVSTASCCISRTLERTTIFVTG